jgi:TonB family protein
MARPEMSLQDLLLRRPEPRFGLAVGLVVAIVVHLLVIPGSSLLPGKVLTARGRAQSSWSGVNARQQAPVELMIKQATAEPEPPKPPVMAPEHLPRGQVVNVPARTVERPNAADYLAEQDQRTDRETRARVTGLTEQATRAPTVADPVVSDTVDDSAAAVDDAVRAKATNQAGGPKGDGSGDDGDAVVWDRATAGGGQQTLAMLTPFRAPIQGFKVTPHRGDLQVRREQRAMTGNSDELRIAMGRIAPLQAPLGDGSAGLGFSRRGGTGDEGASGHRAFTEGSSGPKRTAGLPRNDHLLAEEDDETSLNAHSFRHATFFNRVADAIRRTWVGGEAIGRVDPDGHIYGREDRHTVVEITIDQGGAIVDLAVRDSSGADVLDDEALRSIRAAGPFHNPPRALFGSEDRFSFSFGFNVTYNRTGVDLNWAPY